MSELIPVIQDLITEVEAGRPCALCAVVKTRGSTPQVAGATMVLRQDCSTSGTLGGGCVEEEVKRRALQTLSSSGSGLFDFVLDHDYGWDDGMICGGRMDIAVAPISSPSQLQPYRDAISKAARRAPATLPIDVENEGRRQHYDIHLEVPPVLLIAGAGHVGQAVARMAVDVDFKAVVFDDRADYASRARFVEPIDLVHGDIASELARYPLDAGSYVVIVTRGHAHDEQALEAVIHGDAGYIGLIGSRRKARLIMDDLRGRGISEDLLARVHTPIGLPIEAITVNEIAVSIIAQLIQYRRRTTPSLVTGPTPS